ncbi:hypothetical protein AB0I81_23480 [Nonomuraea sp. NPDC050404]|uniref:hypothetical protein n=1 Tax=Nonomuraea sp. NPDC050404 TaxID=3155783 RepID=UPI0033C18C9D
MLKVEADIFSGRSNPEWVLDETESFDVLRAVANRRGVVAELDSGRQGLGFRGLTLSVMDDSAGERYDLPTRFRIAGGGSADEAHGFEIAERLIAGMPVDDQAEAAESVMSAGVRDLLRDQLANPPFASAPQERSGPLYTRDEPGTGDPEAGGVSAAAACAYWATAFNPGFWNDDSYVRQNNNCYNYAVNRRTNTFAQPGRASGFTAAMSCPSVRQGALLDGAHQWGHCFPGGTGGIWVMALVVAPGFDYHWYRYSAEGFWGHKPGGTAAKNTDNNGALITNPSTAARGPYTNFCGYFQAAYTMRIS